MDTATTKIKVSPSTTNISTEPANLEVSDDGLVLDQSINREQHQEHKVKAMVPILG